MRKNVKIISPALFTGLLLLLLCKGAYTQPAVLLDSLFGTAEVQRAGTVAWVSINRDEKLCNNDVLHINKDSFGRIRWPDNSEAFIHGGAKLLINIGSQARDSSILSYATVFIGSLFFVIKRALPEKVGEDIRIYTPTVVISIRGTAFAVQVEEKTGTSVIKIISGTVRVGCIAKNTSMFLSAPFKTVIAKFTSPIVSNTLLSTDIDSLKTWVPAQVIDFEIARQLSKSRRDRLILSGAMYEKCRIDPFTNTSTYAGSWDIGHAVPPLLAQRLHMATNRLEVLVAGKDTTAEGRKEPVRFRITGSMTFIDIVNYAEITVRADEYRERSIGRVTLQLELHDAKSGNEPHVITVSGERSGKKNNENSWNTIAQYPFDLQNEQFASSIIGSALEQALDAAVEKCIIKMYE
jgi:hypothetical protein